LTLRKALSHFAGYAGWTLGFHLLSLTLVTWFVMSPSTRLQDISDFYSSNEIAILGLGALLYVCLLVWLNPMTSTTREEVFNPQRFEKRFAPGFANGAVIALGLVVALIASGLFRYLGLTLTADEAPLALVGIFVRIFLVTTLVYCEEFVFRAKILGALRKTFSAPGSILAVSVLFVGLKYLQFDLGWMSMVTLFIVSVSLSLRTIIDGDFARGAGFWSGVLIVLHPVLSLPILGCDFQGILLIKYQDPLSVPGSMISEELASIFRYLSGGVGGPVSGVALQVLLLADATRIAIRNRRILIR